MELKDCDKVSDSNLLYNERAQSGIILALAPYSFPKVLLPFASLVSVVISWPEISIVVFGAG